MIESVPANGIEWTPSLDRGATRADREPSALVPPASPARDGLWPQLSAQNRQGASGARCAGKRGHSASTCPTIFRHEFTHVLTNSWSPGLALKDIRVIEGISCWSEAGFAYSLLQGSFHAWIEERLGRHQVWLLARRCFLERSPERIYADAFAASDFTVLMAQWGEWLRGRLGG